jgi:hypothetical protein
VDEPQAPAARLMTEREPWFTAFVQLLVGHGADRDVTVSAVDRLSDLCVSAAGGLWEWEARRDPVLAGMGLTPNQCGALVALLAGSRKFRHNGKEDSLLGATKTALARDERVRLTAVQQRRVATYVGAGPEDGSFGCDQLNRCLRTGRSGTP